MEGIEVGIGIKIITISVNSIINSIISRSVIIFSSIKISFKEFVSNLITSRILINNIRFCID